MRLIKVLTFVGVSFHFAASSLRNKTDLHNIMIQGMAQFIDSFLKTSLQNEAILRRNVVFSPMNLYTALAFLHLGSSDNTRRELSSILRLPQDPRSIIEVHEYLGETLQNITDATRNSTAVRTIAASRIFVHKSVEINRYYTDVTSNFYGSIVQTVDFEHEPSTARKIINSWVAEKTQNHVNELFKTDLGKNTHIILTSALYFKGQWKLAFDENSTKRESFMTAANEEVQVDMMTTMRNLSYMFDEKLNFQAISLPFADDDYSMLILLPQKDSNLKALIENLEPQKFAEIIQWLAHEMAFVQCKIPRLELASSETVDKQLSKMGLSEMFEVAYFKNMINTTNYDQTIKMSEISQGTYIKIDENGATTAHAGNIIAATENTDGSIVKFHANRPFSVTIYSKKSGVVLFKGLINDPTKF